GVGRRARRRRRSAVRRRRRRRDRVDDSGQETAGADAGDAGGGRAMGERTNGVTDDPERLQQDVEAIRGRLTDVVSELDHRRHAVLELKTHVPAYAAAAGGVLLLVGGG